MKKYFFYILILALTFALMIPLFSFSNRILQSKKNPPPNVFFIILDAARADHFSCYGYKKNTTPNIDAISRKGAIFLNAFSQDMHTIGSLPKIFFSRYYSASSFQFDGWQWGIKQENPQDVYGKFQNQQQISLTKALSLYGYQTVFFSGLGLTKQDDFVREFNEFYLTSGNFPEGDIVPIDTWLEKNKNGRFFIYWHIVLPHYPYNPKNEEKEFLSDIEASDIEKVRAKSLNYKEKADDFKSAVGWNENELDILRRLYDGNLKHADKLLGSLFDKLKELSLEKNTLIVISADHGENLGEHGYLQHGGPPFDSVTKIPLIIVYPPIVPAGIKADSLSESIDIMPTILDICGIRLPFGKSMDGISLLKSIHNPKRGKTAVFTNRSIRTKKYKFMRIQNALYDIEKDPGEEQDIAKDNPLIIEELRVRFWKSMRPHLKRQKTTINASLLNFPFYFPISNFSIELKHKIRPRENYINNSTAILDNTSLEEPCLFNSDENKESFLYIPNANEYPLITFATSLPNGTYQVLILLETLPNEPFSLQRYYFNFRFNNFGPFITTYKGILARKLPRPSFYYFDLGKTQIKNRNFSLEVQLLPQNNKPYIIRHIKFVPKGCLDIIQAKELNEEEIRKRIENLKSLGYL
jgi:arylsulfatase A-like enzyme